MILVLLRHGESQWNRENRFTGWTDVPLSKKGTEEALQAGDTLRQNGFDFDVCYTSYLKRAIQTLNLCLQQMDREWLPIEKAWQLNERHYGALQGLNKSETAAQYGEAQVKIWRRSFDVRPPLLEESDPRNSARMEQYRGVAKERLPFGESLADTIERTIPYFEAQICPRMQSGERALIVAHGNSLRALVMHLERLMPEEIMEVNLPTGVPLVYTLDRDFSVVGKRYLGDADEITAKMCLVASQGAAEKEND